MRSFRHPRWQHLDYRVKVATTQENKPPTQGTRQWTFTTPRWRCGSILLPSLNAGVPEPTGGCRLAKLSWWAWGCRSSEIMLQLSCRFQSLLSYHVKELIWHKSCLQCTWRCRSIWPIWSNLWDHAMLLLSAFAKLYSLTSANNSILAGVHYIFI